jgi:hypothetical protein
VSKLKGVADVVLLKEKALRDASRELCELFELTGIAEHDRATKTEAVIQRDDKTR